MKDDRWAGRIQGAVAEIMDLATSGAEVDPELALSEVLEGFVSQYWEQDEDQIDGKRGDDG